MLGSCWSMSKQQNQDDFLREFAIVLRNKSSHFVYWWTHFPGIVYVCNVDPFVWGESFQWVSTSSSFLCLPPLIITWVSIASDSPGSIGQNTSLFSNPPSWCSHAPVFQLLLPDFISYHLLSILSSRSLLTSLAHWDPFTNYFCCCSFIHLMHFITIILWREWR